MNTWNRRLVGIGLISLALVQGCGNEALKGTGQDGETRDARVLAREDVALSILGMVEEGVPFAGSLDPYRRVQIRAQLPGTLSDVYVEQGEAVAAGKHLAAYEIQTFQTQLTGAQASVAAAETNRAMAEHNEESAAFLAAEGAIAEHDLRQARALAAAARAQVAAAEAQLRLAQETVTRTTLRAPFDGVVSRRMTNSGEAVNPGQPLFEVVDVDTLELTAKISVGSLRDVRVGVPVFFRVDAYPGEEFTGRVERVEPVADPATRQITVYVRLPNPDGRLVGGLYATGRIITASETQAVLIPRNAVRGEEGATFVLALENGSVVHREVTLGGAGEPAEWIRIKEGLGPNVSLLVGPAGELKPGDRIMFGGSRSDEGVSP